MSYQHGSNSYIPLLSASHARSSFVCFIDSSNNEDIEDDHNEAGNDSHEYEIGDQNVILNVSRVGSQIGLFHHVVSFVNQVVIFRQVVSPRIEGIGQVGKWKLLGDPFDSKLEKPRDVVDNAEENGADDHSPRCCIFRSTTTLKKNNNQSRIHYAQVFFFLVSGAKTNVFLHFQKLFVPNTFLPISRMILFFC